MRTSYRRILLGATFVLVLSQATAAPVAPATAPSTTTSPAAPVPAQTDLNALNAPLQPEVKIDPLAPPAGPAESAVNDMYLQQAAQAAILEQNKKNDQSVNAKEAQAEADEHDKQTNWLLRNYEAQMRAHAAGDPANAGTADLYDTIASDKDLAKLAGIKPLNTDDPAKPTPKTGDGNTTKPTLKLRPDPDVVADKKPDPGTGTFVPLITPLSAPEAAGLHNFYSSLPSVDGTTDTDGKSQMDALAATTGTSNSDASSTVDVPGLTAALGTPGADGTTPDSSMSLDMLPGESVADALKHQDTFTYSDAPAATDMDQLQNQNIAQMALPVSVGHAPGLPMSPLLTNPALDAKPISAPPVSYSRQRVADPFDILNR